MQIPRPPSLAALAGYAVIAQAPACVGLVLNPISVLQICLETARCPGTAGRLFTLRYRGGDYRRGYGWPAGRSRRVPVCRNPPEK
jgi:hypothetical protein